MSDTQESPRTSLGLEAAAEGDLRGVRKFVSFLDGELCQLGLTEFHPDVAGRLSSLRHEVAALKNYLDGFIDARGTSPGGRT